MFKLVHNKSLSRLCILLTKQAPKYARVFLDLTRLHGFACVAPSVSHTGSKTRLAQFVLVGTAIQVILIIIRNLTICPNTIIFNNPD